MTCAYTKYKPDSDKMSASGSGRDTTFDGHSLMITNVHIRLLDQKLSQCYYDHCNKEDFLGSKTGQFFRSGMEIDEVQKVLPIPDKNPVSVKQQPVWGFMKQEKVAGKRCWVAMNRGEQGEGLIDGTYMDYKVKDILSMNFKFKPKRQE